MEQASSNFINDLSPDVVDSFVYTKRCIHESLRIQPPGPCTMPSLFCKDVNIGGVDFKKNETTFIINFQAI